MSDQATFAFGRMSPAEYKDDREQLRLDLDAKPRGKATADEIRLAPCSSCGGSTFDDGERPLVCHCGATIPGVSR